MKAASLLAALVLAGCAYDPPLAGDHKAVAYQTDLGKCQAAADVLRAQRVGDTPFTLIASVFQSDEPDRQHVRACMVDKGYKAS